MKTKVYTPFDLPEGDTIDCSNDPPITKQAFADECDINNIMARYEATGYLDPDAFQQREAVYGDFADGFDFTSMQETLLNARSAFEALPARIRSRFHNDPAELLDFVHNPENHDEAIKLGLVNPPPPPEPPEAKPAGPATEQPAPPTTEPKKGQSA